MRRYCNIAAITIALAVFILLCSRSSKNITWPMDHFTDMGVLMAGENFAEHGFLKLHFLPVEYIGGVAKNPWYYLHYPPLPWIINGVLRSVGVESLAVMRGFCSLLFVIGLFAMFRGFSRVIGSVAAVCGMGAITATWYVSLYGMSLYHTYSIFFLGLFFLLFFNAMEDEEPQVWKWAGCWIVLLLHSFTSFEFIIYTQIFAWVYVIATRRFRKNWLPLIMLASAPFVGVGLHFLQNVWAIGWNEACADGLGIGHFGSQSRWKMLNKVWDSVMRFSNQMYTFKWPVFLVLGAGCLAVVRFMKPPGVKLTRATGAMLASMFAATTWYLFLPQHASGHPHTLSQLFPMVFIVLGGVFAVIGYTIIKRRTPIPLRIIAILAAVAILPAQIKVLKAKYNRRPLVTSVMSEALGPDALPRNVGVLFNTMASAHFKYFIRRPAWPCPSDDTPFPESIPRLRKHLPEGMELKYYVFYGPPSKSTVDVFNYLRERCPGKTIMVPKGYENRKRYIVLFDISELHKPENQRKPLSPRIAKAQLDGLFAKWDVPGFTERFHDAWEHHIGP